MANFFESELKDVTRLILVRHGRTNHNIEARFGILDECPLDEVGRDQAKRVAKDYWNLISTIFTRAQSKERKKQLIL